MKNFNNDGDERAILILRWLNLTLELAVIPRDF